MEKIAQHIETILRRHDFVIIPDFGGFVTQHQPAKISKDQINPPLSVIGFNPLMNVSDGLLAIEISRSENKSFREAVSLIESEVLALKQSLQQKNKVDCGCLGTLSLNEENKILFSPSENNAFLPANYGLDNLFYSKILQDIEENAKKTVTISIPSRIKIARYAAVGMIAAGLFFAAPKLNDARNTTASLNPVSFIHVQKDSLKEGNIVSSTKPSNSHSIQLENKTLQTADAQKKYYVIVGCMGTQKMAEDLCRHLKQGNYINAHILPKIRTYRVAIESFNEEKDAVNFMENLRKTNREFPDAWVLNF